MTLFPSRIGILSATILISGATLFADTFSGNLPDPNALFYVNFTINTQTQITAFSTSWTGSQSGGSVPLCTGACGFDPTVWLFDNSGTQLIKNDDICAFGASCSPVNLNASIATTLNPGTYVLYMSANYQNYELAGWAIPGWDYLGDFQGLTSAYSLTTIAADPRAITITGSGTVDPPVGVQFSEAPEPSSVMLFALGAGALALARFRRVGQ